MNNDTPADAMKLKPCPFCGSEAEIERYGTPRQSTIYQCTSCGCQLETGEEWGHGADWNKRTTSLAAQDGLVCTGCGSTQSIEQIRAEKPSAFSCCPERKMVPQSKASQVRLVEALEVIAVGEGCMNGIREELSAEALRKIARAALASIEVKS